MINNRPGQYVNLPSQKVKWKGAAAKMVKLKKNKQQIKVKLTSFSPRFRQHLRHQRKR